MTRHKYLWRQLRLDQKNNKHREDGGWSLRPWRTISMVLLDPKSTLQFYGQDVCHIRCESSKSPVRDITGIYEIQ